MKKIRIAGLLLLAPLTLLCACSNASPLTFAANWYKNTSITTVSDTYEKLEYAVTFTPAEGTAALSVEYDAGTYTTELKNETLTLSDGTVAEGYVLTSDLKISGRYKLGGMTGETFRDFTHSVVKFLPTNEKLRPVESVKTVHSTSPLSANPNSLENATKLSHFTLAMKYEADLSKATQTFTDLAAKDAEPVVTEFDVSGKDTFLDNEQIAFALRGLDLSVGASFRTINTVMSSVQTVSVSATAATEDVQFEMDGKQMEKTAITVYETTVKYNTTLSGASQTVFYAATTSANGNLYRNVPLRYESPLIQSLGTLTYSLTKAQFATKN